MKRYHFVILMWIPLLFIQTNEILAQQTTTSPTITTTQTPTTVTAQETAQIAQQQQLPFDLTTIVGLIGTGGGLLWKDKKDKDEMTARLKEGMDILMNIAVCIIKVYNASMLYPEKTTKQILEMNTANNAMIQTTIAMDLGTQIQRLSRFMQQNFNLPTPSMSTPTERVINATTLKEENKVHTIDVKNPPIPPTSQTQNQNK